MKAADAAGAVRSPLVRDVLQHLGGKLRGCKRLRKLDGAFVTLLVEQRGRESSCGNNDLQNITRFLGVATRRTGGGVPNDEKKRRNRCGAAPTSRTHRVFPEVRSEQYGAPC